MKIIFKKISILLISILMFNMLLTTFAFASDGQNNNATNKIKNLSKTERSSLEYALENKNYKNISELSNLQKNLIAETTANPEKYLANAEVIDGQSVLIYNTDNDNVKLGYTDGYVEIVQDLGDGVFLINGEKHTFKYEFIEDTDSSENEEIITPMSTWVELSSKPSGTFTSYYAGWHNIHAENNFANLTIAGLAIIIGYYVKPLAGVLISTAATLIASSYSNTSVAKVYKTSWQHDSYIYRMETYMVYAVYQGNDHYLGWEEKFFTYVPGGP